MSELAAQLVDRAIPQVPVRQWVLSVPFTLRDQLAFDATLTAAVLDVFVRTVFAGLRRAALREGIADAQGGAVTAIRRFGSALNANVHFHSLVLDGVFRRPTPGTAPRLPPAARPHRRGDRPDPGADPRARAEHMPLLAGYAAASIQEVIATGPRAGQPVRRLRTAAAVVDEAKVRGGRREGFSLHNVTSPLPAHSVEGVRVVRNLAGARPSRDP
jgi:hypothetical protein